MKSTKSLDAISMIVNYDPVSGIFTWSSDRNRRSKKDHVAGHLRKDGYIHIQTNGHGCYAHRLAYYISTGENPDCDIDHINGNRQDNRIDNLRKATRSQNKQNVRSAQSNNLSSGYLGVSKTRDRWQARIMIDRKSINLGCFASPEEAHAAYIEAKRKIHSHCEI